jgi:hypothetical protein
MGLLGKLFGQDGNDSRASEAIDIPIAHEANARAIAAAPVWHDPLPEPESLKVLSVLFHHLYSKNEAEFERIVTEYGDVIERNFKAWVKHPGPLKKDFQPETSFNGAILELANVLEQGFGFTNLTGSFTIPETDDPIVRLAALVRTARTSRNNNSPDYGIGLLRMVQKDLVNQKGARARALEAVLNAELGDCQLMMGKRSDAVRAYTEALRLAEGARDARGAAAYRENLLALK